MSDETGNGVFVLHSVSDCYAEVHISWEISLKDISCVDFVEDVIEARVISIGNDGLALRLELGEVVDDQG